MSQPIPLFEMRKLEQLSNTVFGVAMTLLASSLPLSSTITGWEDLFHIYARPVMSLMLTFIVAGLFWLSHHRRLTLVPEADRGVVFLNLLFLMSIIFLPAINSVYAKDPLSTVPAVLYGSHLTIIAALNALLWALATTEFRRRVLATLPAAIFALGAIVAFVVPSKAGLVFMLAFGAPFVDRLWPTAASEADVSL